MHYHFVASSHEHFSEKYFIVNLPLLLEVGLLTKTINNLFIQQTLSDNFHLGLSQITRIVTVENSENLNYIRAKVLLVHLLQHIKKEFLKINSPVPILIHFLELIVHLLLTDVISQPPQQKFEGPTGDIPRIITVVHFKNLFELLYLFDLVTIEPLVGRRLLDIPSAEVRTMSRPFSRISFLHHLEYRNNMAPFGLSF